MTNQTIPPEIGKYKIERPLGQGGMGQVYLAWDTQLERRVAVKCLRPELRDAHWRVNLQREARVLARLNHPNIVQIHDIVEFDGTLAIVTEYVEGRNLHLHLRERNPGYTELTTWLAEISAGLAAAHREGISHNDLKAENILIGPEGTAKINDFGIASTDSDPADDILALGNLASEITQRCDGKSPLLDYLITRMVEKKPAKRPTAEEAAQEFRQIWLASTQVETPLAGAEAQNGEQLRGKFARYVIVGILLVTGAVAAFINSRGTSNVHTYVAVLPTRLHIDDDSDTRKYALLASSVQQGLYDAVMQAPGYSLVSPAETGQQSGSPREIGTALLADELLVPAISCYQGHCELGIERLVGPDFHMQKQQSTSILPELTLEAFEISKRQWNTLYEIKGRRSASPGTITEADYRLFLQLYDNTYNGPMPMAEVLSALEELLRDDPRFLPLSILYAHVAMELFHVSGDENYLDRASEIMRQADRWADDTVLLHRAWFDIALQKRDFGAAENEIREMEQLGADEALILSLKAGLHSYKGEYGIAKDFHLAALKLRPTRRGYSGAAHALYYAGMNDKALAIADKAIEQYPDDGGVINLRGLIYLDRGELDAAIENFNAAIAIRPRGISHSNLGLAYMLRGNYEMALDEFELARAAEGDSVLLTLNRADALVLSGQTEEARSLYWKVVNAYNANPETVGVHLAAQALALLGEYGSAIELLDSIKKQSAEDEFTAALVYAVADQNLASIAKVKQALESNMGFIWFHLPWFSELCHFPEFIRLLTESGDPAACAANTFSTSEDVD